MNLYEVAQSPFFDVFMLVIVAFCVYHAVMMSEVGHNWRRNRDLMRTLRKLYPDQG